MSEEGDIVGYLERGGKLSSPENAPARYRAELMRIIASFVDSELAGAAGFANTINEGPGVIERIAAARIVLEKLDHARKVLKVFGEFGANTMRYESVHPWAARVGRDEDIGAHRTGSDMRLNVFHYPLTGWSDAVVLNVLMGNATVIQLEELSQGSYQPLSAALLEILPRERRHAELGQEGVNKIIESGMSDRKQLRGSIEYWMPRVAATFGSPRSSRADLLRRFGLRLNTNDKLLGVWRERVSAILPAA